MREKERKRLIKQQLDKQVKEKGHRKRRNDEENQMYDELQQKHLELLDEKEQEEQNRSRAKAMREKKSRDVQMREEKLKKKRNDRDERDQEVAQVNRLKDEMQQERDIYLEKRR